MATTQYGPGADVLPHYCCFKIMIDAILLRDLFCKTWMYYKQAYMAYKSRLNIIAEVYCWKLSYYSLFYSV